MISRFRDALLIDNDGVPKNPGVFRPTQRKLSREPSNMSSSPVEATTESASPPEEEQRMPEDPRGAGSWFQGWLRVVFIAALVVLVAGTLLRVSLHRKTQSSGSGSQ